MGLRLKSLMLFWFGMDFVGVEAEVFDLLSALEGFWRGEADVFAFLWVWE